VSLHLGVLRAAGLAMSYRDGKSVMNAQTPMAQALLSPAG
jgi:DNA-binding transcriptional ArsR family regulator